MTTRIRTFALFALAAVLLVAGLPAAAQDTGSADFSRFVALGDSLGAGFVSGGLVRGAQEDSVPALIARQATGVQISQPLVSEPGIPGLMRLVSLSPLQIVSIPGSGTPQVLPPYQNLSVPGYRVGDAIRDRDRGPTDFASFILANQVVTTQLEWALLQQPTFAMVWLGNNDVLAAATSGIVIDGVTLTPVAQFEADYTTVVGALKGAGADLALATLPDVTSIPFVTTIPPVLVNPATQQPVLGPDGNPIPLLGVDGVPLSFGDRVLLTASAKLAMGIGIPGFAGGTGEGLKNEDYLTAAEVNTIQNRVNAYNAIIRETATQTGSAVADINALLRNLATNGYNIGGVTFTEDFVTGGTFSLDGVHPQPLGYAVAANTFIEAINDTYDADIPLVDLTPFVFGSDASAIPSIPGAVASEIVFTAGARDQLLDVMRVWKPSTPADDGPGKGDGKPKPSREGIRVPFRPGG